MRRVLLLLALAMGLGDSAAAQTAQPQRSRLTLAAGLLTSGSYRIGDVTAQARRSAPGQESLTPVLRAESQIGRAVGLDARAGFALSRDFAVEVGGSYMAPQLQVTISQDAEVAGATAQERLARYGLEVSGVYHLAAGRSASRARPFIVGGVGQFWELREDRVTRETGRTIHAGGGIDYFIRNGARGRPFGVRGEARVVHRTGGIEFQDSGRNYPTVSVLAFFGLP
jgi:hypothetical protein